MEGSEYLLTCAEVAVALAGFSALIVAILQRGTDELSPMIRRLVQGLIERSLAAVFLSLAPILLFGLGVSASRVWFYASGGISAYILALALRGAISRRRDPELADFIAGPIFWVLYALGIVVLVLQVLHAIGAGVQQSVWWYLVGLTWLLMSASYLFYLTVRGWARSA